MSGVNERLERVERALAWWRDEITLLERQSEQARQTIELNELSVAHAREAIEVYEERYATLCRRRYRITEE